MNRLPKVRQKCSVENLPELMGYETEMGILFQNLISNAIKFRQPGKEPQISHFGSDPKRQSWQFCVKDNGIGIAPRHQKQIFDIFKRLHTHR